MTTVIEVPTGTRFPACNDEEAHYVCCFHDRITLCGTFSDGDEVETEEDATCVVCHDLADSDQCPVYGQCPSAG